MVAFERRLDEGYDTEVSHKLKPNYSETWVVQLRRQL